MKKERPILFSTAMIQALLAGRKTQTRRVFKVKGPMGDSCSITSPAEEIILMEPGEWAYESVGGLSGPYYCPYGAVGDVLWVREEHYRYGQWRKNGLTKTGRQKWKFYPDARFQEVRYNNNPPAVVEKNSHRGIGWYKRLARFMPKSAARIWLEITDIRAERVQDISEADAMAEGVESSGDWDHTPAQAFEDLWKKINGPESWNANPWVWAISFKILSTTGKPETI